MVHQVKELNGQLDHTVRNEHRRSTGQVGGRQSLGTDRVRVEQTKTGHWPSKQPKSKIRSSRFRVDNRRIDQKLLRSSCRVKILHRLAILVRTEFQQPPQKVQHELAID